MGTPLTLATMIPSISSEGRLPETATDEDILPFAPVKRSGWGGSKEVERVVSLRPT
jgi:hypothetical protein